MISAFAGSWLRACRAAMPTGSFHFASCRTVRYEPYADSHAEYRRSAFCFVPAMKSFHAISDGDNQCFVEFDEWVATVRDPAQQTSEKLRTLESANGTASATYEIAPLTGERYAVRINCRYDTGNMSGIGVPWTVFSSREECIDFFIKTARRHFSPEQTSSNCVASQHAARRQILELLDGGLFGFIEPAPDS